MSGGFALVAWPAEYDVTGVMTFLVNQDGIVREKDLGAKTDAVARAMTAHDPDASWRPSRRDHAIARAGGLAADRIGKRPGQDPASPKKDVRDVAVISGRVERIDPFTRSVILKTADGQPHSVLVGRELKTFDELKPGDAVTVRVTESVVVALRPNAKTTTVEDRTAAAARDARGSDVIQQLQAIVTVERVDAATQMISYKGADNRSVTRMVTDRRLIEGLKAGDTIEIT